jgi:hypothetical protein
MARVAQSPNTGKTNKARQVRAFMTFLWSICSYGTRYDSPLFHSAQTIYLAFMDKNIYIHGRAI